MNNTRKAIIVVDYQNDFVSGALGFAGAELLADKIEARIKAALTDGEALIFTYDTHFENYSETQEGRNLPVPHCIKGTDGHALYGGIAAYADKADASFEKNTFGSMDLAEYVKAQQFEEIELCGLVSNICVISNAVLCKAALPEAKITVDSALTGSFSDELNDCALKVMAGLQITVK